MSILTAAEAKNITLSNEIVTKELDRIGSEIYNATQTGYDFVRYNYDTAQASIVTDSIVIELRRLGYKVTINYSLNCLIIDWESA